MNPYESTAPPTPPTPKRLCTRRYFLIASVSALAGFVIAAPGLVYQIGEASRRTAFGRPYATYDQELYVTGIPVTPGTAQVLTYGVAPLLVSLSAYLIYRGMRNRRFNIECHKAQSCKS